MTGLQMNLSDFTSTPLNHAFMNSVFSARTTGVVPSNVWTSSLNRNACPLCVAKIWRRSWPSTIAPPPPARRRPKKGQKKYEKINNETHPYNTQNMLFTSSKDISVSPLISNCNPNPNPTVTSNRNLNQTQTQTQTQIYNHLPNIHGVAPLLNKVDYDFVQPGPLSPSP